MLTAQHGWSRRLKVKLTIAAGVLAVLAAVIYGWRTEAPTNASETPAADNRPSPIADTDPSFPTVISPPAKPKSQAASDGGASQTGGDEGTQTRSRSDGTSDWAVIAATYNGFSAAERRARSLRSQFADCSCAVFPREGEGLKYYVVVGSGMNWDTAEALRQQAVSAGLPSDTYVTKIRASE